MPKRFLSGAKRWLWGCLSPFFCLPVLANQDDFEAIARAAENIARQLHHNGEALQVYAPFCPETTLKAHVQDLKQQFQDHLRVLEGDLSFKTQRIQARKNKQQVQVLLYVFHEHKPETVALLLNLYPQQGVWTWDLTDYCAEALLPPENKEKASEEALPEKP